MHFQCIFINYLASKVNVCLVELSSLPGKPFTCRVGGKGVLIM